MLLDAVVPLCCARDHITPYHQDVIKGSCNCGAVEYDVQGAGVAHVLYCYCKDCQEAHGSICTEVCARATLCWHCIAAARVHDPRARTDVSARHPHVTPAPDAHTQSERLHSRSQAPGRCPAAADGHA